MIMGRLMTLIAVAESKYEGHIMEKNIIYNSALKRKNVW